jgi:YVTN family beta-propeller protein
MNPRNSINLASGDDDRAPEFKEATGRIGPIDFARTVWLPSTTIPNGSFTNIGLRFRYQQTAPGDGQPRVTRFRYKFRIIADRIGGAEPTASNAYVTTIAGDSTPSFNNGVGAQAQFNNIFSVAVSPSGTVLYVVDRYNQRIRAIDLTTNRSRTLAGNSTNGFQDGNAATARFQYPTGVAISPSGTEVYIADTGNERIRAIDLTTNRVRTIAGNGTGGFQDGNAATAQFYSPFGIAVSPSGTKVYVADTGNSRIRTIDLTTDRVSTIAGNGTRGFRDGNATTAQFDYPRSVAVNPSGTKIYVADESNNRIREIDLTTNRVSTIAGSGEFGSRDGNATTAQFKLPYGVAVNPSGTKVYVADYSNNRIREIDLTANRVSTLAGDGTEGFQDGNAVAAKFNSPTGIAVNPNGTTVYVVDYNHLVRQIQAIEGGASFLSGNVRP